MSLNKTRLCVAPLSSRIVLARFGKDQSVALETRDAMNEFLQCIVEYAFSGDMPDEGEVAEVNFGGGNEQFELTLRRVVTEVRT